jgi:membrane-bound serine protease (ClpP class)
MRAYMGRRLAQARDGGFDCIVLRIDSPGGTVLHSQEIADELHELSDDIHVVAWVPEQALSGACMVAMACDEIVLGASGTLGDCQPIVLDPGGGGIKPVGEKIESPLRALFRKYAGKNGYPSLLAEAFVSAHLHVIRVRSRIDGSEHFVTFDSFDKAAEDDEVIPGHRRADLVRVGEPIVSDEQLLTVTQPQAVELGFVKRTFGDPTWPADEAALLAALEAPGAEVERTEMSFSERASKWLLAISGILSAIVAIIITVTVFQQTFGVIQIVGIIALVLILLINLTADQLHGFPLFLIGLGVVLIAVEVFLIPGFGIPGILGIASMGAGFLFLATGAGPGTFDGRLTQDAVVSFGIQFLLTVLGGFGVVFVLSRLFPSIGPGRKMLLATPDGTATPAPAVTHAAPVALGQVGRATSALRPAGTASFDDEPVDVVSAGGFVAPGAPVRVTAIEGRRVSVEAIAEETA